MGNDTHKLMLDHSKAKVQLYGSYLSKYIRIISQDGYTTRIHIYDLFCGEGVYENSQEGSPMIAVRAIKNHYSESETPYMNITFNDIKPEITSKLQKVLQNEHLPSSCKIRVLTDDYLNLVGQVSKEINSFGNEKALVFLDPKGYKEISISDIKKLLNKKSEVLVFLPIRDMYRFANIKEEDRDASLEPLYRFINEIFQKQTPRFTSPIDFIFKTRDGLKNILPQFYVDTFSLEREQGQFFCLFFFTSHIKGFEKMLETKWELDREQGRAWRYEKTGTMFSGSEILDFPDKLQKFMVSGRKYNSDLYKFCLHEGFLPKHCNEILTDWQQHRKLMVFNSDGTLGREGAFYLNYDKYDKEPEKVYFQYIQTLF